MSSKWEGKDEFCRAFFALAKDTMAGTDLPDSKLEEGTLIGCLRLCIPYVFDRIEPTDVYEVVRFATGTLAARIGVQHWNASGAEKMGSKGERDDHVFSINEWSDHYVSYANCVKVCQHCISLTMKLPRRGVTRARRLHTIGTPLRSRTIAERGLDGASRADHRGYAKIMQDD